MGNLGKDWKDEITESELQSLQYEFSLNGVKEEIRHVLDSEIAKHGRLTPQQMYEVVKKYKTYVTHNKRLDGKSTGSSVSLGSTRLQLLLQPLRNQRMVTTILMNPLNRKRPTPLEASLLKRRRRGYTSLVT